MPTVNKEKLSVPSPKQIPEVTKSDSGNNAKTVPNPENFPDPEAKKNTKKMRGYGAAERGFNISDKQA